MNIESRSDLGFVLLLLLPCKKNKDNPTRTLIPTTDCIFFICFFKRGWGLGGRGGTPHNCLKNLFMSFTNALNLTVYII